MADAYTLGFISASCSKLALININIRVLCAAPELSLQREREKKRSGKRETKKRMIAAPMPTDKEEYKSF